MKSRVPAEAIGMGIIGLVLVSFTLIADAKWGTPEYASLNGKIVVVGINHRDHILSVPFRGIQPFELKEVNGVVLRMDYSPPASRIGVRSVSTHPASAEETALYRRFFPTEPATPSRASGGFIISENSET